MDNNQDNFGRLITYLRISVTDRCNLRCTYCMPSEGIVLKSHDQMLTFEEIERVVRVGAGMGLEYVRLTGGEPLVRPQLPKLIGMLADVPGIKEISMTSNAILLSRFAGELARAGLARVNISLDTLKAERFRQITRLGNLEDVFRGLAAAEEAGLNPIKINAVAMKGFNDDEFIDLARLTLEHNWHVRFIEVMPLAETAGFADQVQISSTFIKEQIENELGKLEAVVAPTGHGPARNFRLAGALGSIGFISPISNHFCAECNRMRLTSDGKLRPCLLEDGEIDLAARLLDGASDEDLRQLYRDALDIKPKGHHLADGNRPQNRLMFQIGG